MFYFVKTPAPTGNPDPPHPLNSRFDPSCGRAMTRTPSVNSKLKVMRLQESLEKHEGAKLTLIVIGLYAAIVLITYLAW
jgi:hypothetical protein